MLGFARFGLPSLSPFESCDPEEQFMVHLSLHIPRFGIHMSSPRMIHRDKIKMLYGIYFIHRNNIIAGLRADPKQRLSAVEVLKDTQILMDHDQNAVIQRAIGEQLKSIIQIEDGVVHMTLRNCFLKDKIESRLIDEKEQVMDIVVQNRDEVLPMSLDEDQMVWCPSSFGELTFQEQEPLFKPSTFNRIIAFITLVGKSSSSTMQNSIEDFNFLKNFKVMVHPRKAPVVTLKSHGIPPYAVEPNATQMVLQGDLWVLLLAKIFSKIHREAYESKASQEANEHDKENWKKYSSKVGKIDILKNRSLISIG
ncbi:hypothetical protein JHK86_039694 [Glycine max]|nr:hypothetical protein JHK86_039694 [Glycine max]